MSLARGLRAAKHGNWLHSNRCGVREDGDMLSSFFVGYYVHERHKAYVHEAARERLFRGSTSRVARGTTEPGGSSRQPSTSEDDTLTVMIVTAVRPILVRLVNLRTPRPPTTTKRTSSGVLLCSVCRARLLMRSMARWQLR